MIHLPSPHFNDRQLPIDMLVLHYTGMPSIEETINWLMDPRSKVSAHYLIDEAGLIYQMVAEDKRAWHAGKSFWQGCTDINSCSLGIELANPGHSHGYLPFPAAQIESLLGLSQELLRRWDISPSRVLAHSDVAPQRKQDPGHLFPWQQLALEGVGLWPDCITETTWDLREGLAQVGYDMRSPGDSILAFQRHFQPHKVDGIPDEETLALLQGLLKAQQALI